MSDVTRILNAIEKGDARAADELLPLVYEELRCLAAQKLAHEKPGQTLQATALVHEAYIRLVEREAQAWNSRGHFFRAAAEAMRRILIENARRKKSMRYGGDRKRLELHEEIIVCEGGISSDNILALDEVLHKFSQKDPVSAELVALRFFAGLTGEQAAKVLGISHNTADKYWRYARAWLRIEIAKGDEFVTK
jgi:RNA polymerase sigma factor (TIGR02999 family)